MNDGITERNPVHVIRDLLVVLKNGLFLRGRTNNDLHAALGNFIILKKSDDVYCLLAHARKGSVKVEVGQHVKEGQEIAQVGHSGNSTAPHLHFQLMDNPDLTHAQGLPCCFKTYQQYDQGGWKPVANGIPGKRVRIQA